MGAGINYTKFDKRESTAAGNQLNGGPTDIRLSDSWGLAAQAGVSYRLNDQWALNAAVATARVKTHRTATTAGQARKIDIRCRPTVLTVSAGNEKKKHSSRKQKSPAGLVSCGAFS